MRLLVCGGRTFRDKARLFHVLDQINGDGAPVRVVIEGESRGADQLAALWASQRQLPIEPYPISSAEWAQYGLGAGPIRNRRMLIEGKPDCVVAFPGNNGTKDMVAQTKRAIKAGANIRLIEVT